MGKKEVRELYIDKCIPLWNDIQHLHMYNQYTHREGERERQLQACRTAPTGNVALYSCKALSSMLPHQGSKTCSLFGNSKHRELFTYNTPPFTRCVWECGCAVHVNVCECSIVCDIEFSCKLNQLKHAFVFQLVGWIFMRTCFQLKFHFEFRISNLVNRHR